MIPALVALGAREPLGNRAMHVFAANPVEGAPPSDGDVAAALTALVSVDCSLTQPTANGRTPLDLAAYTGNTSVVRALLVRGVAATTTSLAHAVKHPGIVRLLLAAGAPVEALVTLGVGATNVTPLMQAAWQAVPESVQLLLGAGASVNAPNERGSTVLMLSVCSKSADAAAIIGVVEVLLAAGAAVNTRSLNGATALHYLAIVSHAQPWAAAAARLLLAGGSDGRVKNDAGKTPAQHVPEAARGGELHRLLLAAAEGA